MKHSLFGFQVFEKKCIWNCSYVSFIYDLLYLFTIVGGIRPSTWEVFFGNIHEIILLQTKFLDISNVGIPYGNPN